MASNREWEPYPKSKRSPNSKKRHERKLSHNPDRGAIKKPSYARAQRSAQHPRQRRSPLIAPRQNDAISTVVDLTTSPPPGAKHPIVATHKLELPDTNPRGKPKRPTIVPLRLTSDEPITSMFLDELPAIAIPVQFRLLQYLQKRTEKSLFAYCKAKYPKEMAGYGYTCQEVVELNRIALFLQSKITNLFPGQLAKIAAL